MFNQRNTYHDVEQEIAQARIAFILGIPTAISFGIVSVGDRYGAMFEMVNSETISRRISRAPRQVKAYSKIMAKLAHIIHDAEAAEDFKIPDVADRLKFYINNGLAHEDNALAEKCLRLVDSLPTTFHLIHGDFHTGNVFIQKGEPLLIDMDRISRGHPIAEISDLYYFYVILGEDDPTVVEKFMGFSYQTAKQFYDFFLKYYLETKDPDRLREVTEKASILGYARLICKCYKKGETTDEDRKTIDRCIEKITDLTAKYDSLFFLMLMNKRL